MRIAGGKASTSGKARPAAAVADMGASPFVLALRDHRDRRPGNASGWSPGPTGIFRSGPTALVTSSPILAPSAAVTSIRAKATGHMAPSSRFGWSLKPSVASGGGRRSARGRAAGATRPSAVSGDGGCRAGAVADGAIRSSAAGRLTVGEKSQGAVEVVVRELPDEVEATLGHRRVDFPYVFVVQLSQLLVLVHLACLDLGEPAGGSSRRLKCARPPACRHNQGRGRSSRGQHGECGHAGRAWTGMIDGMEEEHS
jgi:hypothetical protein